MTCISQAARPLPDGSLQIDKPTLRKIVTMIFQYHWPTLEPALRDTKAAINKTRLRPGDFSQRLSQAQLACIATHVWSIPTIVGRLGMAEPGKPALEVSSDDASDAETRLRWAAKGELWGPYPAEFVIRQVPAAILTKVGRLTTTAFSAHIPLVLGSPNLGIGIVATADGYDLTAGQLRVHFDRKDKSPITLDQLVANSSPPQQAWIKAIAGAHGIDVTIPEPKQENAMETDAIDIDLNPTVSKLVNGMLAGANLPPIEELLQAKTKLANATAQLQAVTSEATRIKDEVADLRAKITTQLVMPALQPVAASGAWPSYRVEMADAAAVFRVPNKHAKAFSLQIPTIVWDGPAPACVPAIDEDYILRPDPLLATIYSIVTNTNIVATGETGTGKTTHFEQVAARMRFPVEIINLDSEITRMDIMGRDVLDVHNGVSVTRFEEGIVPRAMQRPGFLILDEFDFGRPDVMYALQRVLTGTGLTLTEDGGRFIAPHPLFRIAATGNTKGQGDETGFYQGARIQSAALLNRFGVWTTVDYMGKAEVESLLKKRVEIATDDTVAQVSQYTIEHQRAFSERTVATPFSMRDAINLTRSIALFQGLMAKEHAAAKAIKQTVLARATDTDAATLKGIADRIFV